jgi:hypothetical protein
VTALPCAWGSVFTAERSIVSSMYSLLSTWMRRVVSAGAGLGPPVLLTVCTISRSLAANVGLMAASSPLRDRYWFLKWGFRESNVNSGNSLCAFASAFARFGYVVSTSLLHFLRTWLVGRLHIFKPLTRVVDEFVVHEMPVPYLGCALL